MNKKLTFLAVIVIAAGLIAYLALNTPDGKADISGDMDQVSQAEESTANNSLVTEAVAEVQETVEAATDSIEKIVAPADNVAIAEKSLDVSRALAPRSLGDENAPLKIAEYASLTCSHCASFHTDTFPSLKENYIDTGKVHFTFYDFPLNAAALEGSSVARCLPEGRYFQFLKFLFENQDDWAFSQDYSLKLRQNSKLLGLNEADYDTCVESDELKGGLLAIMQEASQKHEIKSTPSFVFNGKETVSGALPYEKFKEIVDKHLEEAAAE